MTEQEYKLLKTLVDALGHSSEIVAKAEAMAEAGLEPLPKFVELTVSWKALKAVAAIVDGITDETWQRIIDEDKAGRKS